MTFNRRGCTRRRGCFVVQTGFSTAYIGSSNLSKSALIDGVEWNVRLSEVGSPDVLEKFDATFRELLGQHQVRGGTCPRAMLCASTALLPQCARTHWMHHSSSWRSNLGHIQSEILEKLDAERKRHGRWKNLVVAATGTGKTIVAALDYKRLRPELGGDPRLLFVAHRQEILKQSLGAFRQVLQSGGFGELYVDGAVPSEWRHVFGSVQSLSRITDLPGASSGGLRYRYRR